VEKKEKEGTKYFEIIEKPQRNMIKKAE